MPEHQQLGVLRLVPAEHQNSQAKSPAHEQADDLEQHPASQPSPCQACSRNSRSDPAIEYSGGTGSVRQLRRFWKELGQPTTRAELEPDDIGNTRLRDRRRESRGGAKQRG
jgi:hypothetical protein